MKARSRNRGAALAEPTTNRDSSARPQTLPRCTPPRSRMAHHPQCWSLSCLCAGVPGLHGHRAPIFLSQDHARFSPSTLSPQAHRPVRQLAVQTPCTEPVRPHRSTADRNPADCRRPMLYPRTYAMAGVTLIELTVTLAVAAILLTIAVPSFQSVMRTNRIAAVTNELSTALQLARSEAVTRGTRVTVCKSDDVSDGTPTCNSSASWQNGWLVFVDNDQDGTFDPGELALRVVQPSTGNAVITSSGLNFANYISFTPTGESRGSTGLADGTLFICIAPAQRSVILNSIGRLRIAEGSCP